ncbi:MAG: Fur family transcriptional regulator [Intestinibacillus sp.]
MTSELLQSAGLRRTHQREIILRILVQAEAPMAADEIHALAAQEDRMGLSTTYRVLAQLTEHGLLLKNDGGDGRFYYQLNSPQSHKHTLHCTVCGDVVPIEGCPLGELERRLCEETGYVITGHSLAFTGVCPNCRAKGASCPSHSHTHEDDEDGA